MLEKDEAQTMRKKKIHLKDMSEEELLAMAQQYEEQCQRRNARRRERRKWLKTAPREETALRYRAQEQPCTIALYLQVERFVLRWMDEFPDLKGDATLILLTMAHNILHLLHPEESCAGDTLADCSAFSIHDVCTAAIEIALNFNLDPVFKLTRAQVFGAMMELSQGVDRERLHFNALLDDLSIDL